MHDHQNLQLSFRDAPSTIAKAVVAARKSGLLDVAFDYRKNFKLVAPIW